MIRRVLIVALGLLLAACGGLGSAGSRPPASKTGTTAHAGGVSAAGGPPGERSGLVVTPPATALWPASATGTRAAPPSTQPPPAGSADAPRVTGDAATLPPGCQPEQVAGLVTGFFDAVNRGDQEAIARIFSPEAGPAGVSPQGWYSVTDHPPGEGRRHFVAYSQGRLLAYFQERHGRHERLRLLRLQVSGGSWHGGADVVYTLRRGADDLGDEERTFEGKGAINCARRQVFVWSMGDADDPAH